MLANVSFSLSPLNGDIPLNLRTASTPARKSLIYLLLYLPIANFYLFNKYVHFSIEAKLQGPTGVKTRNKILSNIVSTVVKI